MHHKAAVLGAVFFVAFLISSFTGAVISFICAAVCIAAALVTAKANKAAAFIPAGLASAFLIYAVYSSVFIQPLSSLCNKPCTVSAVITSVSAPDNDNVRVIAESRVDNIPVRFSFFCPDLGTKAGDTAEIQVVFSEPAVTASYNGDYDYSRGIFVRASVKDIDITRSFSGFSVTSAISDYSEYLRDIVKEELSGDERGLILAMCFGDKSMMSAGLYDDVKRSGLSHMTAVSGMHISLLAAIVIALLDAVGLRRRRILRFSAVVLITAAFMVFFNMSASVIRSGIMLVIYHGAQLFRRKSSAADSLGAATLIILLAEPCACRDAGLMMSVCGTLGAGVLAPAVTKLMSARFRVPGWAEVLTVGSCAAAATLPLSMLIFGRFSTVSPLTSVIVSPLFCFIMICSLAVVFSGGLLAEAVLLPAGLSAKAMIAVMRFFSGAEYTCISIDADTAVPFTVITVLFALITFFVISKVRAGRRPAVISALLVLCVLTGILTFRKLADSDITTISVFSDGSDYFTAVRDNRGVSAFSSSVNSKLSSAAYDALTDAQSRGFTLLCVLSDDRKHGAVHSDTFDEISATVKYHPENDSKKFDISGKYTAQVYEEGILLDINGVSVVLSDVAAAPVFGPHDIAIYSGYKKNERYGLNGVTVLCDKRYTDITDAFSAYYYKTEIRIDSSGKVLVKTE